MFIGKWVNDHKIHNITNTNYQVDLISPRINENVKLLNVN